LLELRESDVSLSRTAMTRAISRSPDAAGKASPVENGPPSGASADVVEGRSDTSRKSVSSSPRLVTTCEAPCAVKTASPRDSRLRAPVPWSAISSGPPVARVKPRFRAAGDESSAVSASGRRTDHTT